MPIRIVVVDGTGTEWKRIGRLLRKRGDEFQLLRAVSGNELSVLLERESVDLVMVGGAGGGDEPLSGFSHIHAVSRDIPLIVCSDRENEELAVGLVKAGAQDVVVTGRMDSAELARCILCAVQRQHAITELNFALASEKVLMEELDRKNRELVELSITDGLTGLYNHRFIQERFDFEFKRAKRYGIPLSCMLLDIDHFKSINDTYGHQFGDVVLVELARLIQSNSREVDICGRYGGEEFLVITNLGIEDALKYATKLHASVENHLFSGNDRQVHVTVSIGLGEFNNDIKARQQLLERADTALYWAKRDGRNMIRVWKEIEGDDIQTLDQFSIEGLKTEFMRLSSKMRATYMESTNALVRAIDAKDHYTREHSLNVSRYAVQLARTMGLSEREVEIVKYAGLLHDVGKIGISHEVLTKAGPPSTEEFEMLRKHPVIGVNILKDVKFLEKELPIILHHHERYDGKGYPYGLKGREIPLGARILAVVDAYDAMTTNRCYRRKLSRQEAIAELRRGSGGQFAPDAVTVFIDLVAQSGQNPEEGIAAPVETES